MGGVVNQSRNLAAGSLAYGPPDLGGGVRWVAVLPHVARLGLRGERPGEEVEGLVGRADAARVAAAGHMPSYVALRVAELLREGRAAGEVDPLALALLDAERVRLLDHVGGCERILSTPLPRIDSIRSGGSCCRSCCYCPWPFSTGSPPAGRSPLVTLMLAYPLVALDQMGVELENPFAKASLSHLPLDALSDAVERNLFALLAAAQAAPAGQRGDG